MPKSTGPTFAAFALAIACCSSAAFGAGLPPSLQGDYPVHIPDYNGIEQILVLSNRWIIACTTQHDAVRSEIDKASGGELSKAINTLEKRAAAGKGQSRRAVRAIKTLYTKHEAEARRAVGEFRLNETAYYTIRSETDANYEQPQAPTTARYHLVSLDGTTKDGADEIYYGLYSYLEFPHAMKDGARYTVRLENGKQATFLYDETRTVSRAIKVNQLGYLPNAKRKFAYLGAHLYGIGPLDLSHAKTFEVQSVTDGAVVLAGEITPRDKNSNFAPNARRRSGPQPRPQSINGEDVYQIDLSPLKTEGNYFIRVPGVGRSWPFRVGDDVYGEAFYTTLRGFYHQRCGIACTAPYTQWPRQACHTEPIYESDAIVFGIGEFNKPREPVRYRVFDVVGATTDTSRATKDARGGWHDAADWDRNARHYAVLFDLLYAYELNPRAFTDKQLNLPESGNGIPDLLDEVDYGMRVWTKSMNAQGGVSGSVQTWTHPKIDANVDYAFSRRTRWNTLAYAAAAAQLSQHLRAFNPARADEYAALAKKAYTFGADPKNSLGSIDINAAEDRGRGAPYTVHWHETEAMIQPYLVLAKVRMFLLTGDRAYVEDIETHLRGVATPTEWPYTFKEYSPWFYFSLLRPDAGILDEKVATGYRRRLLLDTADTLVKHLDTMPYRRTWPRDQARFMGFGASDMTNPSRVLLIAHALTGDDKYRQAAILNADFMFGANPLGMSWTTGIGSAYPVVLQHAISTEDGIRDPVPGITIYGVTDIMFRQFLRNVWKVPGPKQKGARALYNVDVPVWRRYSAHPRLNTAQCEFTIHETMASTALTAALLLPEGWTPNQNLISRGPRDESHLFGYWYLP